MDLKRRAFAEVRAWKLAFFLSLALLSVAVGALAFAAMRPPFVPYVVAVDRLGVQLPIGAATRSYAEDPAVIASELNRWIVNVRTVTSDAHAQAELVRLAYAYVADGAARTLNAHFGAPANDPRVIAQRVVRMIDVRSVLPLQPGSSTWVVLWDERAITRASGASEVETWQAFVTVKRLGAPAGSDGRTEEQIRANPFGLYVTDLSWSRISNPTGMRRGEP